MLTYNKAKALLDTAKSKDRGKPIARNTRLFDRGTHIAVRFHNTDIVSIYPNGVYELFTNGWCTVTTKERMNRYISNCIYQYKHEWYIQGFIPFTEGMFIDSSGIPCDIDGKPIEYVTCEPKRRCQQIKLFR